MNEQLPLSSKGFLFTILVLIGLAHGCVFQGYAQSLDYQVAAHNEVAFELYRQLAEKDENLIFSPYSIYLALSMVYEGAGGETAQEMASVLQLNSDAGARKMLASALATESAASRVDSLFDLSVANALWIDQYSPLEENYVEVMNTIYGVHPRSIDFDDADYAAHEINRWVDEATRGNIRGIISSKELAQDSVRAVVANTVYFKGKWTTPFKLQEGDSLAFQLSEQESVKVDKMVKGGAFHYLDTPTYQYASLPYTGTTLEMGILLPKDSVTITDVGLYLTAASLSETIQKAVPTKLHIVATPFKIDSSMDLEESLTSLGLNLMYDKKKADFWNMMVNKVDRLYVEKVIHMAKIDFDTEGTVAAAATAVSTVISTFRSINRPIPFVLDRPFMYVICDRETGLLLFIGHFVQP